MLRARVPKEMVILGLGLGLVLALAEPVARLINGGLPWDPATGLTGAAHERSYLLHLVPYGIDRGICDRTMLANELKATSGARSGAFGGSIAGPLVASAIGARMDMVDQNCVGRILEFAPDSRRVYWRTPDSGVTYAVVPTRTYQNALGAYCREFHTSASNGSHLQQLHGVACRRTDGTWRGAE